MPVLWIALIVLAAAAIAYVLARRSALASAQGDVRRMHSLPSYYGWHAFIMTALPALLVVSDLGIGSTLLTLLSAQGRGTPSHRAPASKRCGG